MLRKIVRVGLIVVVIGSLCVSVGAQQAKPKSSELSSNPLVRRLQVFRNSLSRKADHSHAGSAAHHTGRFGGAAKGTENRSKDSYKARGVESRITTRRDGEEYIRSSRRRNSSTSHSISPNAGKRSGAVVQPLQGLSLQQRLKLLSSSRPEDSQSKQFSPSGNTPTPAIATPTPAFENYPLSASSGIKKEAAVLPVKRSSRRVIATHSASDDKSDGDGKFQQSRTYSADAEVFAPPPVVTEDEVVTEDNSASFPASEEGENQYDYPAESEEMSAANAIEQQWQALEEPDFADMDGLEEPLQPANATSTSNDDHQAMKNSIAETPKAAASVLTKHERPLSGSRNGENILISRRSPAVRMDVTGPDSIVVGKVSDFEVLVFNAGEVPAQGVVVTVMIPNWTDLVSAESTSGTPPAMVLNPSNGSLNDYEPLEWKLPKLKPGSGERLKLHLIPRTNRKFDLAVQYAFTPMVSQAFVEVREAKLVINVSGPREVMYGDKQVYRLTLSNPGTGDAENVMLQVYVGQGKGQTANKIIPLLQAGESKTIEIELQARQKDTVSIRARAMADGGLSTEASEDILVRRAAVVVDIVGPKKGFARAEVRYLIRVANPGNAVANKVRLAASLPQGAEFISASHDGHFDSHRGQVGWMVGSLRAGEQEIVELLCQLNSSGSNPVRVGALAEGNISDATSHITDIEAVADIVLDVRDPVGIVPVGQLVTYQVRVKNRGTKAAHNIEMFIHFSPGIEPVSVEGGDARLHPGQVEFTPLATLPARAELLYNVRAQARNPGNHTILVEVNSVPLGIELSAKETTRFANAEDYSSTPAGTNHFGGDEKATESFTKDASEKQFDSQTEPNRLSDEQSNVAEDAETQAE